MYRVVKVVEADALSKGTRLRLEDGCTILIGEEDREFVSSVFVLAGDTVGFDYLDLRGCLYFGVNDLSIVKERS